MPARAAGLLHLISSAKLLRELTPTRRLLGAVVSCRNNTAEQHPSASIALGLALSDPYLSFASPLPTQNQSLVDVLRECDAEGVVIGLQLASEQPNNNELQKCIDQLEMMNQFPSEEELLLPATLFEQSLTPTAALDCFETDPLWDQTGMDQIEDDNSADQHAHSPDVQAAIMLQHFLDTNCGGWQNTFG